MSNNSQFEPTDSNGNTQAKKPSIRNMLIGGYAGIGILVALYQWQFGPNAYKGLAYALGQSIFWPAVIFPGLGKAIGGLIWIIVVIALFLFVKAKK